MSDRKGKGKPARIRVPVLLDQIARIHRQISTQHHPGDRVMLQIQEILETIMATKDPRDLHANLCAYFNMQPPVGRPKKVEASASAVAFVVDRFLDGKWEIDRCRKVLSLTRTQFQAVVTETTQRREEEHQRMRAEALARNRAKLNAPDY